MVDLDDVIMAVLDGLSLVPSGNSRRGWKIFILVVVGIVAIIAVLTALNALGYL